MATDEKRYQVAVRLEILDTTGGLSKPFFENETLYTDMPTRYMLGVERALLTALSALLVEGEEELGLSTTAKKK